MAHREMRANDGQMQQLREEGERRALLQWPERARERVTQVECPHAHANVPRAALLRNTIITHAHGVSKAGANFGNVDFGNVNFENIILEMSVLEMVILEML